ncbi:retrovirus-related Pol polyprotein from transposon 17.6 [Caerostris darwini]|uniref:Retrovirus-related Pol polyprotein from transposon 17.6 n=1 Tax=Caerostris darwini TaxID=1538125 RepID=A0AAV4SUY2_9ARAC|nr:retrovirus-related Pol polyprotein from transposon 17.6 [Caerostris darwini]
MEYTSRLLTPVECNYSSTEMEALEVVWAVKKFCTYFKATEVTVESNHQSLKWLLNLVSNRLARWALELKIFNLKLQYITGKAKDIADMLSLSLYVKKWFPT